MLSDVRPIFGRLSDSRPSVTRNVAAADGSAVGKLLAVRVSMFHPQIRPSQLESATRPGRRWQFVVNDRSPWRVAFMPHLAGLRSARDPGVTPDQEQVS